MKKLLSAILTSILLLSFTSPAEAVKIRKFKNCTALNKVYPHGVAKKRLKQTASGLTGKPFVNTKLYNKNSGLDRDKDGVACEK